MYFTADNKLYKVNSNDHSYQVFSPPPINDKIDDVKISPNKIFSTAGDRLLISSHLGIYELKKDQLINLFPAKGYTGFSLEKIYAEKSGTIWAITSRGIFKTDTSFNQWVNINNHLGWNGDEDISEIYFSKPGELIFSGNGKIGVLKDSLLQKSLLPPPVIISRLKQGEKDHYMVSLQTISIHSSYKESLEFELASTNFMNEKENKLFYQLDGWDKHWKELSGQPVVRYEQLPPGNYIFSANQMNAEGAESKITSVKFTISPPFYQEWWFIPMLLVVAGIILFIIYRIRIRKAVEMEKLRNRIATDLHDDIGATLSSISMYSDTVKQQVKEKLPHLEPVLDKMGESSRNMVNSMSDIVWAINPGNDDGSKLVERMENYAKDLCAMKNILLQFTAAPSVSQLDLPLEYRKNVYLIFKESLNNALKYSGAKNIQVSINSKNKVLQVMIKDDGKGFDNSIDSRGNGLKNIEQRAKEIKGTTAIESEMGKGTTVLFSCSVS
jgi:two-component sensor histidine kinase